MINVADGADVQMRLCPRVDVIVAVGANQAQNQGLHLLVVPEDTRCSSDLSKSSLIAIRCGTSASQLQNLPASELSLHRGAQD